MNLGGALLGNIIALIVQVLPLILIPILLKGILDSVPLLGKAAQNLMNKTTKSAGGYASKDSSFFGRRRAEYANNQRNILGIKQSPEARKNPRNRTLGNRLKSYQGAQEERLKEIQNTGTAETRARMLDSTDNSLSTRLYRDAHASGDVSKELEAGTTSGLDAHRKQQIDDPNSQLGQLNLRNRGYGATGAKYDASTEARWKEATTAPTLDENGNETPESAALNRALSNANPNLDRASLVRQAQETAGYAQRGSYADNKRQTDYAKILENTLEGGGSADDKSLLAIAGGTLDIEGGQKRAQAVAVETQRKIAAQNVAAAGAIAQNRMDAQQLKVIQSKKKNEYGEPLDANDNVIAAPNTILEGMLRNGDMYEALAARDAYMQQGQAGVVSGINAIQDLEQKGGFKNRQEILTQLKRTQLSEHGKATKENMTSAVRWAQGAESMVEAKQNADRFKGLTTDQLAGQAPPSLVTGIANGGVDQEWAAQILSEDRLRSKFDSEQIQMLQMLKDHGSDAVVATWSPDSGKRWAKMKASSAGPAPTYSEWKTQNDAAKESLKSQGQAPDPTGVDTDAPDTTPDINGVEPNKFNVPKPGSPVSAIKAFIDKAGAPNRMSRDTFIKLQQAVGGVPQDERKDDNNDLKAMISQIDAEVVRRNGEVDLINRSAAVDMTRGSQQSGPANKVAQPYDVVEMPNLRPSDDGGDQPAPQPQPAPQQAPARGNGYPRAVPQATVASEIQQASVDFNITPQDMGISNGQDMSGYSQDKLDQMFATLRSYRQSIRNTQGQASAPSQSEFRDALQKDMQNITDDNILGNS